MDKWDIYEVPDTGRRGEPRPGCAGPCMYCWGQCMINSDAAFRELFMENGCESESFAPTSNSK